MPIHTKRTITIHRDETSQFLSVEFSAFTGQPTAAPDPYVKDAKKLTVDDAHLYITTENYQSSPPNTSIAGLTSRAEEIVFSVLGEALGEPEEPEEPSDPIVNGNSVIFRFSSNDLVSSSNLNFSF